MYANYQGLKGSWLGMNQISDMEPLIKMSCNISVLELVQGHLYQAVSALASLSLLRAAVINNKPLELFGFILTGNTDRIQLCAAHTCLWHLMTLENPSEKPPGIAQRGTTVKNKPYFLSLGLGGSRNYFGSNSVFLKLGRVILAPILSMQGGVILSCMCKIKGF